MDFLIASENLWFTIPIAIMFGIAILESLSTIFGFGMSSFFDNVMPDWDWDLDLNFEHSDALSHFYTWFNIGNVPAFIVFVLLLTYFGIIGLIIQFIAYSLYGFLLAGWIVIFPSLIISVYLIKTTGKLLAKVIPKDETSAVSEESFIGKLAIVTIGCAKKNSPAQAKLKDEFGKIHYIMVCPENDEIFETNTKVITLDRKGSVFIATKNIGKTFEEYEL